MPARRGAGPPTGAGQDTGRPLCDDGGILRRAGCAGAAAYRSPGPESRAIAVLPFVNSSADPENEYFSDGMTDELITALTKVEGLQVASRTSVFALKNAAGGRPCSRCPAQRLGSARGHRSESGQPDSHHGPADQRCGRADALVGALRSRDGGRICHSGRDRRDHRANSALNASRRARRSDAGALHRERAGV